MVDQTPTLPAIEPSAGTDAQAWASSVQQARSAGLLTDQAYARYGPALERAFTTSAPVQLAPEQRTARMEELRQGRIAGTVTDREFREFEALAAVEKYSATALTVDERLQGQIGEIMAPAKPHEYDLTYPATIPRDEAMVDFDSGIREAFVAAGIPKHLGGPIFEAADRLAHNLAKAPPEVRQQHIAETTAKLHARWGNEFKARVDAVDELVAIACAQSPGLAEIIDEAPYILADESIWLHLDTIAQHRKRA